MEIFENGDARLIDEPVPGPARDLVGYGPEPRDPQWPDGARVAISLVVNYEEGSEYSFPAGDQRNEALGERPHNFPDTRDLRVESVHEYGSRAGIWRLLRLFADRDVRATLFATAVALERNPEVTRRSVAAGHEICGHGWRWSESWLLDRDDERRRLHAAIASIERTCDVRPVGWCCRNASSVNTRELLVEEGGFLYDSDAYNDDLPYYVDVGGSPHLVIPYDLVHNDIRYVTSQGFSSPRDFVDVCTATFDQLWEETGRMMSIGLHPRWAGQPARTRALAEFIDYANSRGGAWFARRRDIAEHWWRVHPPEAGDA